MKNNYFNLIILVFVAFSGKTCLAQEAVVSTGANATGSGGSVSFSVGQVSYHSNTSTSGSATEGVQQPYEIFPVSLKEDNAEISISVFPNPSSANLVIEVAETQFDGMYFQIFDGHGKMLKNQIINSTQTAVVTENWPVATYFVSVSKQGKELKKFQIIKN